MDWSRNDTEWVPAPEGLHQAVCVDVEELGEQTDQFGTKEKGLITWQIAETHPETGKRFLVSRKYTVSLHVMSALRKDLEMWRGKKYTKAEIKGYDPEKLIGANAQIQVVHKILDDGRVFSIVQAIVPAQKGVAKMVVEDYTRKKDRPDAATKTPTSAALRASGFGATPADDSDDVPF